MNQPDRSPTLLIPTFSCLCLFSAIEKSKKRPSPAGLLSSAASADLAPEYLKRQHVKIVNFTFTREYQILVLLLLTTFFLPLLHSPFQLIFWFLRFVASAGWISMLALTVFCDFLLVADFLLSQLRLHLILGLLVTRLILNFCAPNFFFQSPWRILSRPPQNQIRNPVVWFFYVNVWNVWLLAAGHLPQSHLRSFLLHY